MAKLYASKKALKTYDRTLIGSIIHTLPPLRVTRKALYKSFWPIVSTGLVGMVSIYVGDPQSAVEVFGVMLVALAGVSMLGLGTWLRRALDRRDTPTARRKEKLMEVLQIACRQGELNEIHLRRNRPKLGYLYRFPDADNRDGLLHKAAELNTTIFSSSTFKDSFDAKYERNESHQVKNEHAIMLIAHPLESAGTEISTPVEYIGFTHLIPINKVTYRQYLKGEISDIRFSDQLVCSPSEPAYAILVFSLGLHRWRMKEIVQGRKLSVFDRILARIGIPPFDIGSLRDAEQHLWVGFVHHLQVLLKNQKLQQLPVILLAQSFNEKVSNVLTEIGFRKIDGKVSADEEDLFEIKVWPPQ